jgi:hypothetical protein
MAESAHRKPDLKDLSKISRTNLEALVSRLVEKGQVSAEVINGELDSIRETTGERVKAISETEKQLSPEDQEALLGTLKSRFETNRKLHEKVKWNDVEKSLKADPEKLWSLQQLESTGGEPDVIAEEQGEFVFGDCSAESPKGRRNVVFDKEAEEYLKKNFPNEKYNGNAADMAAAYGVDFMDKEQYRALQKKLPVDKNTWSWLKTPADIRKSGLALYGGRYDGDVYVDQRNAYLRTDPGAFRASLRVKKA